MEESIIEVELDFIIAIFAAKRKQGYCKTRHINITLVWTESYGLKSSDRMHSGQCEDYGLNLLPLFEKALILRPTSSCIR